MATAGRMLRVPFVKMHGLGNDYVYVDCVAEARPELVAHASDFARWVSRRQTGVGSDGLVLVLPGDDGAAVRMRMFNADGSEAEMCGNALRCVAVLAGARGYAPVDTAGFTVNTGNGPLHVRVHSIAGDGPAAPLCGEVSVDMGCPILEPAAVPVDASHAMAVSGDAAEGVALTLADAAGEGHRLRCVSFGNPHGVLRLDAPATDAEVSRLGPFFERHAAFPRKANIGFACPEGRAAIALRVWERGSGETQACGTGACAAAVALMLDDAVDREVEVRLPGGSLRIAWPDGGGVTMTGPGVESFEGATWWPLPRTGAL